MNSPLQHHQPCAKSVTYPKSSNRVPEQGAPIRHTRDKNGPSCAHTSPHHYNDALDPASSSHNPYTTSASRPSHTQTHLFYKTPPGRAHQHLYANSQPSLAVLRIPSLQAHHLSPRPCAGASRFFCAWRYHSRQGALGGRNPGQKARRIATGNRLLPWTASG